MVATERGGPESFPKDTRGQAEKTTTAQRVQAALPHRTVERRSARMKADMMLGRMTMERATKSRRYHHRGAARFPASLEGRCGDLPMRQ